MTPPSLLHLLHLLHLLPPFLPVKFLEIIELYGKEVAASGYSDYDTNLVGDENDDEDDDIDGDEAPDGEKNAQRSSIVTTFSGGKKILWEA